jgi:hypothetical protein
MRRALYLLPMVIMAPAWAHLELVTKGDGAAFYIDHHTIRRTGNLARVWEVQDLQKADVDGELSRRTLVEYDCKVARSRSISMFTHAGAMGTGQTLWVGENPSKEWHRIPPGTPAADIRKIVCAH